MPELTLVALGTETDRRRGDFITENMSMDLAALAAIAGGADAEAVACAAREAEWRALNWTAEKLVLHAAQRAFVASHDALATTKQAAERLVRG